MTGKRQLDIELQETTEKKTKQDNDVIALEVNDDAEENNLKLRIDNFDKFVTKKLVEKLLGKHELKFGKVKIIPKSGFAIVHCSRVQSDEIKNKLHNSEYKNRKLFVSEEIDRDGHQRSKESKIVVFDDITNPSEKIAKQTTPLYQISYEKQLEIKHSDLKASMKRWKNELLKYFPKKKNNNSNKVHSNINLNENSTTQESLQTSSVIQKIKALEPEQRSVVQLDWVKRAIKEYDGLLCELVPVIPSPKTEGYRSKYEFTFGRDLTGEKTCGFLLGLYKEGVHAVLNPIDLLHVSEEGKRIANMLQNYVKEQDYDVYDRIKQVGVYRSALVRTLGSGECMIVLQIDPKTLSIEQIQTEKTKFRDYVMRNSVVAQKPLSIISLYIQLSSESFNGFKEDTPSELLHGNPFVTEILLGLSFQISPTSFFQVNPSGTEVLYSKIKELVLKVAEDAKQRLLIEGDYVFVTKDDCNPYISQPDVLHVPYSEPGVVLLDLCCGTGTIGICMAKHVKKVIGVEMVEEAVLDAKRNAVANGVDNVTYLCGKVEDMMLTIFREHIQRGDTVIAVLDPPRSGVHSSVIRAIRDCHYLDYVVFVACAFKSSMQNFVDLSRPTTNKFRGYPFIPKIAVPVDLFPHTDHCELIVEMEREKAEDIDLTLLDSK